ncbi:hypothetical protein TYRP_012222 [Tyrophagus putrescentiae]|nr:hypothetical protein TYRP_012222 [Tyrophagus putrescentiae]
MDSLAVHGTRRRGLAPLGHCKLPLPRVLRAERAGPEAAEVYSGQAMSGEPPWFQKYRQKFGTFQNSLYGKTMHSYGAVKMHAKIVGYTVITSAKKSCSMAEFGIKNNTVP